MPFKDWEEKGAFLIPAIVFFIFLTGAFEPLLNLDSLRINSWGALLTNAETFVKILAIIVGGTWAYYKFIKGRVYKARVEPKVTGTIERIQERTCLVATLQLKNVGASKVAILRSSRLDVSSDQLFRIPKSGQQQLDFESVPWEPIPTTFRVFSSHQWIESGETIEEQIIIALRIGGKTMLKLELHTDTDRTAATAMTLVRLDMKAEETASKSGIPDMILFCISNLTLD